VSSSKISSFAVHAPTDRAALVLDVQAVLGVPHNAAEEIVEAFDEYLAKPLQANLAKKTGRDLGKRNPMIYTARGLRPSRSGLIELWRTGDIGHRGSLGDVDGGGRTNREWWIQARKWCRLADRP